MTRIRGQIRNARKLLDNSGGMYIPFKARLSERDVALLQHALNIGSASLKRWNDDGTNLVLTPPYNAFLFAGELGNYEVEVEI